jgi:hypothetical protein
MQPSLSWLVAGATIAVFAVNWIRQLTLGEGRGAGLGLCDRRAALSVLLIMLAVAAGIFLPVVMRRQSRSSHPNPDSWSPGRRAGPAALDHADRTHVACAGSASRSTRRCRCRFAWSRTTGQGFKLVVALLAVELPLTRSRSISSTEIFGVTGLPRDCALRP